MKLAKRRGTRLAAWVAGLYLIACGTLPARTEKPGATIVAHATDGRIVQGELLSVGNGEIEVLVKSEAAKVRLRLDELDRLRIKKKDRTLKGLGTGLLIGGGLGLGLGLGMGNDESGFIRFSAGQKGAAFAILFGGAFGLIGALDGAIRSSDETIRLKDHAPDKVAAAEAKLAKYARFGYRRAVIAQ